MNRRGRGDISDRPISDRVQLCCVKSHCVQAAEYPVLHRLFEGMPMLPPCDTLMAAIAATVPRGAPARLVLDEIYLANGVRAGL
jgi:hypothetical protein